MVKTEEVMSKVFTVPEETELTKFDGTYEGDVSGDSTGKLIFKAAKAKNDKVPAYASGSYSLTPVGQVLSSLTNRLTPPSKPRQEPHAVPPAIRPLPGSPATPAGLLTRPPPACYRRPA